MKVAVLLSSFIFAACAKSGNANSIPGAVVQLPPALSFALAGWTLTLPIDSYGGTGGAAGTQYSAQTISTAQLLGRFVDNYFYVDSAGALVFIAPSNGAVTTPGSGSDHTRSELREVYSGPGADANNDWRSSIGGTLTGSCIVRLASLSSDEVTIAQIHNQSSAFVLLMLRPSMHDIAVAVYTTATSGVSVKTSVVGGVDLGSTIDYQLTYAGTSLNVLVNGTTLSMNVDSSWTNTPVYFKLGAYHASPNIGNPASDQTRVDYLRFSVTH